MRCISICFLLMTSIARTQSFQTTVIPLPNEAFAAPCHYDLSLPAGHSAVRAVWVTFDRGRDIMKYDSDPDVVAFARHRHLALMMPHQCPAKEAPGGPEKMDMDPSHGVARALFTALDQFARQTGHAELSSAKLILLGFSGTGALFAHFVGYAPERVAAAILAAPGHYDPAGVDRVQLPPSALEVPELIIVGGADRVAGAQRPYNYFRSYRDQGAPWTFLVQNKTPHCCVINTKPLLLARLDRVIKLRQPSPYKHLRKIDVHGAWEGSIRTCPSPVVDTWGTPVWNVCAASIQSAGRATPGDERAAGWLPSHRFARELLDFIQQLQHPSTSLP